MRLRNVLFPKFKCPACGGRMAGIPLSVGAFVLSDLLFQALWALVAAAIAAVTFKLLGDLAGFIVLFVAIAWLGRDFVSYRCESCGREETHRALERSQAAEGRSTQTGNPSAGGG
jgi:predicted RNA-binding Zn-ribbon protein involved in translation (DUF1610 family)